MSVVTYTAVVFGIPFANLRVFSNSQRLDIVPIVCNVEQVRILRGRGAIQPGVNRCKLLSTKDFDILYKDCTTARYVHRTPIGG